MSYAEHDMLASVIPVDLIDSIKGASAHEQVLHAAHLCVLYSQVYKVSLAQ